MDNLPQSELDYQRAHIGDDLSHTLIGVSSAFTAIAVLLVIARLVARRYARAPLGLDDYLASATVIPLIGVNIAGCLSGRWGIGRVLLRVAQHPEDFVRIGKAEFALSICYDFSMLLGKLSVLALLARVFTLHAKWFKIGIYFWTTWTLLWWTAGCLLVFLQCRPLSTNWGVPFQCRPSFTTSISTATLNAISDLGVLLLPQPLIWNLQLPMKRKLQVSLLFLVGGFATAIGVARLPSLRGANSGSDYNVTYTSAVPVMFTIIEPASVLMCACLPMVPALWKHIPQPKLASYFSRFLGRSRGTAETSGTSRDPLPTKKLPKAAGWTQLNETSSSNQAKRDRQAKRLGSQSNEDYELSPTYAGNIV